MRVEIDTLRMLQVQIVLECDKRLGNEASINENAEETFKIDLLSLENKQLHSIRASAISQVREFDRALGQPKTTILTKKQYKAKQRDNIPLFA